MDLFTTITSEPARWGDTLLLLIGLGLGGFAGAITTVGLWSKVVKEGLYWFLSNKGNSFVPPYFQDTLIKVTIPFLLVLPAWGLAVIGHFAPLTSDTLFGALQVAGTVAIGPYVLGFLKSQGQNTVQGVKDSLSPKKDTPEVSEVAPEPTPEPAPEVVPVEPTPEPTPVEPILLP